jgi:hypothetical protein
MRVSRVFVFNFIIILIALTTAPWVSAQEDQPPKRQTTIVVSTNQYEWWLIRWNDNQITCVFMVDQEGLPADAAIQASCGQTLYDAWKQTPPCEKAHKGKTAAKTCSGMYLYLAGYHSGDSTVVVELPPPTVWVTLSGCSLSPPDNLCTVIPSLLLTGEEPLPNEQITAIHAIMGDFTYNCADSSCQIPLQATPEEGIKIEFWADSSFGDTSEHFTVLVRVLDSGVSGSPGGSGWYVDVLGSQWRGGTVESCAQIWQAFPPVGGPPAWLSTPSGDQLLASDKPYHYLAGRLIDQGLVTASDCPGDGLLSNGYANACGLEKARPMIELWQNQFDPSIYNVAKETGLPAQLMKNLFAQESQFWPGAFRVAREYGLGQLTVLGADTILLWNPSFFDQFCPLVLDDSACARGYLHFTDNERAILSGALAIRANADCADCTTGIDLSQADYSVMLFAQSLLANCEQVSQTVYNATGEMPGTVSNYEDLWRFTLANYHAGPGCLAYAIYTTWDQGGILDWESVSANFTEACQGVQPYVDLISR